jgi:DNA polymerase (family 10)
MHAFESNSNMARLNATTKIRDRRSVAEHFLLTADLLELHSGDESEAMRYREAASLLKGTPDQSANTLLAAELDDLPGLDPEMRAFALEILEMGEPALQSSLQDQIPASIRAMLPLPGLGPKRLRTVWKEMGITDAATLQHAATENRLVHQKGFGPKTQEKVLQSLAQARANARTFTLSDLRPIATRLERELRILLGQDARLAFTGEFRRGLSLCDGIEMIADPDHYRDILLHMIKTPDYEIMTAGTDMVQGRLRDTEIPFTFKFKGANYHLELFRLSGSKAHVDLIPVDEQRIYRSEAEIYEEAGLPFLAPELREGKEEVKLALSKRLPRLIQTQDIKGLLHAHSTYSDGSDSLEAMANQCRAMGMEYLGISDHGPHHAGKALSRDSIAAQHREIDRLNQKMAPFRILKGVEAEILPDGSLGMSDLELASFDFVIASLHAQEPLSRADATIRLLKAIQNPYTTVIGHVTGRMILGHEGQPVDVEAVIDACAAHHVAIELNCHPSRMDLDWQWIRVAVAQGVRIAINPNAHSAEALSDYETGVIVARKGLVSSGIALNAQNLDEMEAWLEHRRAMRIR